MSLLVRRRIRRRVSFASPGLSLEERRRVLDRNGSLVSLPRGTMLERVVVSGVPCEWILPYRHDPGRVVLFLHGGAYTLGSCNSHRGMVAHVARACRARALLPEYRLAPEHPFPAALEDAVAVYRFLLGSGVPPGHVTLMGDSAGGGLALATLLALRDAGDPLTAAAVCISPWTDLAATGETLRTRARHDVVLRPETVGRSAALYHGGHPPDHPLVSPLYADLAGLPPLLVQVGGHEILLSDATRLAERARNAGVEVTLRVWPGMWHVWHGYVDWVPESRRAIREIAEFADRHRTAA
ncbi:MAG TPA: alpha/beta hydrolase [Longimicrobiaceae bacterium]|nr:alpha/beta hydrolase [Longimicrobiaceae bacterium]